MRYLLILICFLWINSLLYCQDKEPAQKEISIDGIGDVLINPDTLFFKQDKFNVGWGFGFGYSISKHLRMNQILFGVLDWDINNNTSIMLNIPGLSCNAFGQEILQSVAVHYEPTLLIDNPLDFKTRPGDNTDPIFGFENIKGHIFGKSDSSLENYSRLNLYTDSLVDEIVLSNPYPNPSLPKQAKNNIKSTEIMKYVNVSH